MTAADGKQINAPVNNQSSSATITDTKGNVINNNGDNPVTRRCEKIDPAEFCVDTNVCRCSRERSKGILERFFMPTNSLRF